MFHRNGAHLAPLLIRRVKLEEKVAGDSQELFTLDMCSYAVNVIPASYTNFQIALPIDIQCSILFHVPEDYENYNCSSKLTPIALKYCTITSYLYYIFLFCLFKK